MSDQTPLDIYEEEYDRREIRVTHAKNRYLKRKRKSDDAYKMWLSAISYRDNLSAEWPDE